VIEISRILCPIDFSEASRRALEHAVAFARWYEAKVVAFHVSSSQPLPVAGSEFGGYATALPPAVKAEDVIEEAKRFCQPLSGGTALEIVVRQGNPVKEIVQQAEQMRADLLVIGTHGRSGFERLFLGSVTEKVLRKAPGPVLTVPPPIERPLEQPVLFKTILCPLDFSPSSTRALEYALSLAKEADARLILLHVIESPLDGAHLGEMAHFTVPEYGRQVKKDALTRLKAAIPSEARVWCTPEEFVTMGKAHREILRVATETGAELIVMGVQGRGAVDLMLFGSTTNEVIRTASRPVLTLRS
jgi:nucleotide-binding universal stress UspA family protein